MTDWTLPPYADPARFTEEEITLDAGGHVVPGTLTLPRDTPNSVGVVLLAGSGPFDRDETAAPTNRSRTWPGDRRRQPGPLARDANR